MVKFLIIRFSSIGDIVLTTPVVRCLKTQLEDAEIHFVTKKAFSPVIVHNPYIDKVHVLDDSLNELIHRLEQEKFDYIIDLHHNIRSLIVKSKLKVISFSFHKINVQKWLMVNMKVDRLPRKHIVDRYLDTTRVFDLVNDNKGLDFFIEPADEVDIDQLPESHRNGYIGFVIGAKHATKKLPNEQIISIIKGINLPVVLLGGKEDEVNGNYILEQTGTICYNACGMYNIGQSASLITEARLIITHDTGLMHIAAAFKKKIISLWGNTIPEFGMYPYLSHPDSQIIEVKGLKCRPCTKIGFDTCPKNHFNCMTKIDISEVISKAKNLYNTL